MRFRSSDGQVQVFGRHVQGALATLRGKQNVKGLVVDEPWISLLLSGEKSWEMRSTHTSSRGRIALIRRGTGTVVGIADLVDSIGPLDDIAWRAHQTRHLIPMSKQAETRRWDHAWVLECVRPLVEPVPYVHPDGAVIWVRLPQEVENALVISHPLEKYVGHVVGSASAIAPRTERLAVDHLPLPPLQLVPVAKDGSWFSPNLLRADGYRIGPKGEEFVIESYADALSELRLMKSPRWRRPNNSGNWGIVTGVRWMSASDLEMTDYASEQRDA